MKFYDKDHQEGVEVTLSEFGDEFFKAIRGSRNDDKVLKSFLFWNTMSLMRHLKDDPAWGIDK